MRILALISALILTSCATPEQNARTILDRLEFDEDETGCVDIRGEIDLNPVPLFTSNATIILKKSKGENPPIC